MVNKEAFAKRLHELMAFYEITASNLADSIGVQRSSISHILAGRNKPSLDFILRILDNYPTVSFEWLVRGIGTLEDKTEVINITTNSSTPTLFDDLDKKTEEIETHFSNKASIPISEINNANGAINQIVIFYKDGSFKSYIPK